MVFQHDSPADLFYLLNRVIARRGDDAKPKLAVGGELLEGIREELERAEPRCLVKQALAWFVLASVLLFSNSNKIFVGYFEPKKISFYNRNS